MAKSARRRSARKAQRPRNGSVTPLRRDSTFTSHKARVEYSLELATEVCLRITSRDPVTKQIRSLQDVCAADDMPGESTVRRWRTQHPEFGAMYARGKSAVI